LFLQPFHGEQSSECVMANQGCKKAVWKYVSLDYLPLLSSSIAASVSSSIDFSLPWSSHSNWPAPVTATASDQHRCISDNL